MATILDAAQYILEKTEDSIPYLKLERLCYYAQAWSMAWDEEPIFPEAFYAGEKAAVCYELFDGVGHQLFVSLADSAGGLNAAVLNAFCVERSGTKKVFKNIVLYFDLFFYQKWVTSIYNAEKI